MAGHEKLVLFGARYDSAEAAERDYDAVKSLYYDMKIIDTFDAAILNKDENGKVTIVKKHEQPTRSGGWRGAGIGLATGAVIALFPAAASRHRAACGHDRGRARFSARSPDT